MKHKLACFQEAHPGGPHDLLGLLLLHPGGRPSQVMLSAHKGNNVRLSERAHETNVAVVIDKKMKTPGETNLAQAVVIGNSTSTHVKPT